ncbi:hypothetical protein [Paenibacillus sp. GCM10027626]|uniref:hypothetical protein n=1 Tax=Paenibacillus sp. GCM10027626 TaxID=3273411 RepID=UPI003629ACD5
MDPNSKHYKPSYEGISKPKKGNAQLFERKGKWYFAFTLSFEVQETPKTNKAIGVDRGLRLIAVAADTGNYLTFNGKRIGHIRRRYAYLRRENPASEKHESAKTTRT